MMLISRKSHPVALFFCPSHIISPDLHILMLEVSGMKVIVKFHIKEVREKKGISIRRLAELSGVNKSYISDIESGRRMPTVYILCVLAAALEVQPAELFSYEQLLK